MFKIGGLKLIKFSKGIENFISKKFGRHAGINLEDISIRPYGNKVEIKVIASGLIDASDYEDIARLLKL